MTASKPNNRKAIEVWQPPDPLHADLGELLQSLELPYESLAPYSEALTHASYANETTATVADNERLEFLGDAVIELVVSSHLFHRFPEMAEGSLTRMRAALVCTATLARCAQRLGLARYMLMGRGEEEAGGRKRPGLLADLFEAFTGALFVDSGLAAAQEFIMTQLSPELQRLKERGRRLDAKGQLQSWYHQSRIGEVQYELVREEGPDHDKWYAVEVRVDGEVWGTGEGGTKKEAQKAAAREAVDQLEEAGIIAVADQE